MEVEKGLAMVEDNTAKSHILSVLFLEQDPGRLNEIEKALADDPRNQRLRAVWLQELHEYLEGINHLYEEWQFRFKEHASKSRDLKPLAPVNRKIEVDTGDE